MEAYNNTIDFAITGDQALFFDPVTRNSENPKALPVPTYESLKGACKSIYWKPTFDWVVDAVRIINPIATMSKDGINIIIDCDGKCNDIPTYCDLTDCEYQVRAHFAWNLNRPEYSDDRNYNKHLSIAVRSLSTGGRRSISLGDRNCPATVKPCTFGEGKGYYDYSGDVYFGTIYHSITYPDGAYDHLTYGHKTINYFNALMRNGVIHFPIPEKCKSRIVCQEMSAKVFNFKRTANRNNNII